MVKVLGTVLACVALAAGVASGSTRGPVAGTVVAKTVANRSKRFVPAKRCARGKTRRSTVRGAHGRRFKCVAPAKAKNVGAHAAAIRQRPRRTTQPPRPSGSTPPPTTTTSTSTSAPAPPVQTTSTTTQTTPTTTPPPPTFTTTVTPVSPAPPPSNPGWAVQPHTETWAYDDCGNGGTGTATAVVRAWVTYAETNCGPGGDTKALGDCHAAGTTYCQVIQYLDTNWIYSQGSPPWNAFTGAASESWYQHTPGSQTTRVATTGYGGGYLINQSSPAVQSFFQSYARHNYDGEDGLMMDDQSASLSTQLYYASCGCSSTNEVSSTPALRSAHESMSAAMTHTSGQPFLQIDNTLPPNPFLPQGFDMLDHSTGVQGLIKEGSPMYNGNLDPYYSTLLDEIAYAAAGNGFVVPLSYGSAGASYQAQSRRVQEATMLLGYSPGHVVDWADLEQGSNNLAVWPEEGIFPTAPVQSMGTPGGNGCLAGSGDVCATGGHNDVQVAPGVYRREFAACYNARASFGRCAAVVNTTGSPVTVAASWLTQPYGHLVTFNGGDVQSGGAINLTGAPFSADSTAVASHDAILLAP